MSESILQQAEKLRSPILQRSIGEARHRRIKIKVAKNESFKLLSSWVVSGARQFWVGGNFAPVKILEIPVTQLVQEAFLTNTGTSDVDWIVGIKTIKPNPAPEKQQIYTVYGDGRPTDFYEGIEVRYLYYAGDGLWVSDPTAPEYDFYAQSIPADPPVDQQRWDFGWRGFYVVGADYYFDDGFASGFPPTSSAELDFDPVTCTFPDNQPRAEEFVGGWYWSAVNTPRPYVYHATTSSQFRYTNPVLNFNYSHTVPTVSGFPSNAVLYQFTGTNQRTKNISSVANYSGFWGANSSSSYYDDSQTNQLAIVQGYPVTSPEFNSTIIQTTQITQNSQYISWFFYNGQLNSNQGNTNVSVTREQRSIINAPPVNWDNRTLFPFGLTSPNVYTGYSSLSPGRVNTIQISTVGTRLYNGKTWISPFIQKDSFLRMQLNQTSTDTATDILTSASTGTVQRQNTSQATNNTTNWLSKPSVTHYKGEVSVLSWQRQDTRNNPNDQNVFKKIVCFENTEIEINANFSDPDADPSWQYAFLRYHAAQWIDRSKYYWVEMPSEMGIGIDDAQFWNELEFPEHTTFSQETLTEGRAWLPKEYNFDSSDNKFKKAEDFEPVESEPFPIPQNATEQRIYDVRYVRD